MGLALASLAGFATGEWSANKRACEPVRDTEPIEAC
jgi:hypothetical protein